MRSALRRQKQLGDEQDPDGDLFGPLVVPGFEPQRLEELPEVLLGQRVHLHVKLRQRFEQRGSPPRDLTGRRASAPRLPGPSLVGP